MSIYLSRTVRNKDGTTRTFKTIHRMTEAEMQALATQSIKVYK